MDAKNRGCSENTQCILALLLLCEVSRMPGMLGFHLSKMFRD